MTQINTDLKQNDKFLKNAYLGALFPCMFAVMGSNVNILVDGIIVGQKLGVDGLAALNFCMPVWLTLCVIGSFLVSGTAIGASAAVGRNDVGKVQQYYHLSIGCCLIASIAVTALGLISLDGIVSFLCREDSLREMVKIYTGLTILGAAPKIFLYIPFWFLRLDGRNRHVTIVMCTMAGCNIVLDYLFLFGLNMGMLGAALASVIATLLAAVLGFIFLCDKKSGFHMGIAFKTDEKMRKTIMKDGSPAALNNLAQALRILLINTILMLYGNTVYVAMFAAINCISEFSLCLVQGVPQAASAMLGVYSGEQDNGSARILMRLQWKYGALYALVFGAVVIGVSQLIAMLYGLDVSLYFAMACLAVSVFPALLSGIFSGYYSVSSHTVWANLMIFCRVLFFPVLFLYVLYQLQASPWPFMVLGEAAALLFWWICIVCYGVKHKERSRYLLMNDRLSEQRQIVDFSVEGNTDAICDACERISEFCEANDMTMKQVMRMSLSMEELMMMIVNVNGDERVSFDLRLYAIQEVRGIRIRYNGAEYNPFSNKEVFDEEDYLGIKMIYNLVETVFYQRTFGMNMLQIMI